MLYEAEVTPSFATVKPSNFFKFLRNHSRFVFPPASSTMSTQLWSMVSVKSRQHNNEFMESACIMEGKSSDFWTILLKRQNIRIFGVSLA